VGWRGRPQDDSIEGERTQSLFYTMWNGFRLQKYRNGGQLWAVNVFSYAIHAQTDCWTSCCPLALSIFFLLLLWRFLSSQLFCVHYTGTRCGTNSSKRSRRCLKVRTLGAWKADTRDSLKLGIDMAVEVGCKYVSWVAIDRDVSVCSENHTTVTDTLFYLLSWFSDYCCCFIFGGSLYRLSIRGWASWRRVFGK
jgi:hypothetical protein